MHVDAAKARQSSEHLRTIVGNKGDPKSNTMDSLQQRNSKPVNEAPEFDCFPEFTAAANSEGLTVRQKSAEYLMERCQSAASEFWLLTYVFRPTKGILFVYVADSKDVFLLASCFNDKEYELSWQRRQWQWCANNVPKVQEIRELPDKDKLHTNENEDLKLLNPAAVSGNVSIIESMSSCGNMPFMATALHNTMEGDPMGADQSLKNDSGENLLHSASQSGNAVIIERVLSHYLDINSKDGDGETPLIISAENGKGEAVNYPLDRGAHLSSKGLFGRNLLHIASQEGNVAIMETSLSHGIYINSRDRLGETPLMIAARFGKTEAFNYPLDVRADPFLKDPYGRSLLPFASESGKEAIIKTVLSRGLDNNSKDGDGETPLGTAARFGKTEAFGYLLIRGANLSSKGPYRKDLLHVTSESGKEAMINRDDETGLMIAAEKGKWEAVNYLLDREVTAPAAPANSRNLGEVCRWAKEMPSVHTLTGAVTTTDEGSKESEVKEEFVCLPKNLKGYVIGKGRSVLKKIQQESGVGVVAKPRNEDGFTVTGNREQIAWAKKLLLQKVDGGRVTHKESQLNKDFNFIHGWNLPADCHLKLEQIAKEHGTDLPESPALYRIKPAKSHDAQESCCLNDDPSLMSKLDTLEAQRKMKKEWKTRNHDMFIIHQPIEDETGDGEYSIEEAFSMSRENRWRTSFKGGVNLNEKILKDHLHAFDKTPAEYREYWSRYNLTFYVPNGRQIFLRLWATKKNLGKRLEDSLLPACDIKNALEEIHFKSVFTRSRCRGWPSLPSKRYMRASILFPGCDFDCRLTITGHDDSAFEPDHWPSEETKRNYLTYLTSELTEVTFADEDDFGLRLPERNMPDGFELSHMQCCERSLYGFMPGFTIVFSKEISPHIITANSRVSTALYLLCDEWEELLHKGGWEPEAVGEKLPDFLRLLKRVQSLVVCEMDQPGLSPTIPAEILARGPSALEAHNKALADGKTLVNRVPIMLIGQDRAEKTSLKMSLRGICFDPEEDSTIGIDVDPLYFEVTTETWKTGTTEKGQILVVENLKRNGESFLLEDSREEIESTIDFEVTEILKQPGTNETPKDVKHVEIPSETRDTVSGDVHQVPPRLSGENPEVSDPFAPCVPEDVAVANETLLQGGWKDGREHIYSTLLLFCGQSVYYVNLPLSLTQRAGYCLVDYLSLNPDDVALPLVKQGDYEPFPEDFNFKTHLDYHVFRMRSVASLANLDENRGLIPKSEGLTKKFPAVFLDCTHADTPYGKCDAQELAYKALGYLRKEPSYGDHLFDVFVVGNTKSGAVSDCQEVVRLHQQVLARAKTLLHTIESISIKIEKVLSTLRREKGDKWIFLESAKQIASEDCNIVNDGEFETLMNYLHDLRSLVHFYDSPTLSKLVVLDPPWLIDLFKKVITVQLTYECKEEKFSQLWGKLEEEEGILDEQILTHVWKPLFGDGDKYDSLVDIMEKFSLLCCWPSGTSANKSYLVPSMLTSHPPDEIVELLASAKIPSLFLKFKSGHVPPGLFPRLVLKFFQCCEFWKQAKPKFFHNFARFFTSNDENCSVILLCHFSSVEIVVHRANPTPALAGEQSSVMALSTDFPHHKVAIEVTCVGALRRRLGSMIECMRIDVSWLWDIEYEMGDLCPECCNGGAVNYCLTHKKQRCKEEQCLHFLSISKLFNDNGSTVCDRSALAPDTQVSVMQFSHWYDLSGHQLAIGERDRRSSGEGNEEKAIALPDMVRKSLLSQSCDSKEIVNQFKESLKLSQASLEMPDDETKKWIRSLAREANASGSRLLENLDVRAIPIKKGRQLTMALSVGDDWKLVAEELGLNPAEIRFLDNRILNPAEATLSYVAHQRLLTVGDLYGVLAACHFPLIADDL
ncbi:uncharacterized protein LOC110059849 isoform X1 [Orbicella faveolata]|uniref:uncharacterized protein LOC110059849 isoform X1 n=2 Tax=Orbicella faveolata TaxID=48498 RepID=UPI0009E1F849|nr:uncharacterized protein LOC110059849 isoform X1 [Orbicella faveolata]